MNTNSKIFAHIVNAIAVVIAVVTALAGAHIPVLSALLSGPIAVGLIALLNSVVHAINPTDPATVK